MARDRNPNEKTPYQQAREFDLFMSRTQRAVITTVDTSRGKCSIEFESTSGSRVDVNIPFDFISIPGNGTMRKAAWKRSMPRAGDFVLVGFDSNGSARLLGYDHPGYELLADIQADEPFGYKSLKEGEHDQRSSGGAYTLWGADGTLFLAGGMASLTMNKDRFETKIQTGTLRVTAGKSIVRTGRVRRTAVPYSTEVMGKVGIGIPPTDSPATAILPNLTEHTIDLRGDGPLPMGLPMWFMSAGDVIDPDIDIMTQGAYGVAGAAAIKRFKTAPTGVAKFFWRLYNSIPATGIPIGTPGPISGTFARPFEWGIDQFGNSFINVGLAATAGYNVWSPNHLSLTSSQMVMAGNVFLGCTALAPMVTPLGIPYAGSPMARPEIIAGGPAICGTPFVAALTAFVTALEAFSGVAAGGTAVTTPVDAIAYCKALGGAAVALGAGGAALLASAPLWLSKAVFVAQTATPNVVSPTSVAIL
jgi:hypothetical protein